MGIESNRSSDIDRREDLAGGLVGEDESARVMFEVTYRAL